MYKVTNIIIRNHNHILISNVLDDLKVVAAYYNDPDALCHELAERFSDTKKLVIDKYILEREEYSAGRLTCSTKRARIEATVAEPKNNHDELLFSVVIELEEEQ